MMMFTFLSFDVGIDNFSDDIALMLGEERRPGRFWQICWKYISPLILLVNFSFSLFVDFRSFEASPSQFTIMFSSLFYQDVTLDDYVYPRAALTLGWFVVIACLCWLPYMFFSEICSRGTWNVCALRSFSLDCLCCSCRLSNKLDFPMRNGVRRKTNIDNYPIATRKGVFRQCRPLLMKI